MLRDTKEDDGLHAQLCSLTNGGNSFVDGVSKLTGHRADRAPHTCSWFNEEGPDKVISGERCLSDQRTDT